VLARLILITTVQTRYEHDAQGQLTATSLPDGSVVRYVRNGQGQVVGLERSQVGTQWLKRFESAQVLMSEMERDAVGLKRYTAGNGVKAEFIRSREGALARVVYRAPAKGKGAKDMRAANEAGEAREVGPLVMGFLPGGVVEKLLAVAGMKTAHAAEPAASPAQAKSTLPNALPGALPGALGEPVDPSTIIDHRYLWGTSGNLLLQAERAGQASDKAIDTGYAYDGMNRLIVVQQRAGVVETLTPVSGKAGESGEAAPDAKDLAYYLHDELGRRILAKQMDGPQGGTSQGSSPQEGNTREVKFEEGTSRWVSDGEVKARYDDADRSRRPRRASDLPPPRREGLPPARCGAEEPQPSDRHATNWVKRYGSVTFW
jgi:YD repeat-containing protein